MKEAPSEKLVAICAIIDKILLFSVAQVVASFVLCSVNVCDGLYQQGTAYIIVPAEFICNALAYWVGTYPSDNKVDPIFVGSNASGPVPKARVKTSKLTSVPIFSRTIVSIIAPTGIVTIFVEVGTASSEFTKFIE